MPGEYIMCHANKTVTFYILILETLLSTPRYNPTIIHTYVGASPHTHPCCLPSIEYRLICTSRYCTNTLYASLQFTDLYTWVSYLIQDQPELMKCTKCFCWGEKKTTKNDIQCCHFDLNFSVRLKTQDLPRLGEQFTQIYLL